MLFKRQEKKELKPNIDKIRLQNILKTSNDIILKSTSYANHPIFDFIRLLCLQIVTQHMVKSITDGVEPAQIGIERFFYGDSIKPSSEDYNYINRIVYTTMYGVEPVIINLAKDPVLASNWSSDKFVSRLTRIGDNRPDGEWKQQNLHSAALYLPLGITEPTGGGNHSISDGVIKSAGLLKVNTIYVIDDLYSFMYFDGLYFRKVQNDSIISRCRCFEFGCIFEIGRLIKQNNIHFKGLAAKQIKA